MELSSFSNAKISEWLSQFSENDRDQVSSWLKKIKFVDAEEFRTQMIEHIFRQAEKYAPNSPVALYVERELKNLRGKPQYAFHQKASRRPPFLRAYGKAAKIKLIQPLRNVSPEVGSEGPLSNIGTQLQRENRHRFFLNPGPEIIREKNIHFAFIICDFIGTGTRIRNFLESFWQMPTVKSWHSLKIFNLHVLAYSGTKEGISLVRNHPSEPKVDWIAPCPTLNTEHPEPQAQILRDIFIKYDPVNHDPIDSLGFRGQGTMLVFGHGCPNNSPRVLYKKSRKWKPLFPERSNTLKSVETLDYSQRRHSKLDRLAPTSSGRLKGAAYSWAGIDRLLVMTALKAGVRFNEDIAHATGLDLYIVESAFKELRKIGWVSQSDRLTSEGYRNLALASPLSIRNKNKVGEMNDTLVYYPKSLRPPL